jgi:hypothetical protein
MTLDKILEGLEEQRMEDLERDMFGDDDDVGYYDYIENDNRSTNTINPKIIDFCGPSANPGPFEPSKSTAIFNLLTNTNRRQI